MDFRNTRTAIITRVGLLTLTIFLVCILYYNDAYFISQLIFFVILILQLISLVRYLENGQVDLSSFLDSISYDESTNTYSSSSKSIDVNNPNLGFNKVLKNLRNMRKEREDDFQYLKNIVQHVGIGLITFDKEGSIQIMNTAAKKLLKVDQANHIKDFLPVSENLVDIFKRLRTGGRDLIRLDIGGDIVQLAVYAIELTLRGVEFKLVSLQNIQSELEEKEMEAWQNLVRVLTHEIMNSVTPISSLANTVEDDLKHQHSSDKEIHTLTNDEIEDLHLAMKTIKKRSQGLIRFVQDFRNLTHIPKPKLEEVEVRTLLDELLLLLKSDIAKNNIKLNVRISPESLTIVADKELIEQVVINLIKNATQAFDDQTNKLIEVSAYHDDKKRPIIAVKDNGNGIDEEALEKIFIPFFTTKKSGSGIGLSLSRQIMRQHQGMLNVKSKVDEGTEFFLKF